MQHRHLNHEDFTLAAIDDIISNGTLEDWEDLHMAILKDPTLLKKVKRICNNYILDPYAQCYHFWNNYVETS
jgi:hypothetical protein